ncbi:MAG: glycoside hydrolase family 3 protein [Clostridia bacterium]|nr:glycoside hydrolase family 3 protein [Clostridia bacterium]
MKRFLILPLLFFLCGCSQKPAPSTVDALLSSMTLEEKCYQLLVVTPEALTGIGTATQAGDATKTSLIQYPVGGVIYFAKNLKSPEQTRQMLKNTREYSKITPFLSVDEEGGLVARVADTLGTTQFSPMYTYREQGETVAYENAASIACDLKDLGFQLNYAPVADVWTNPQNTVISTRAYSDSPEEAAQLVSAAVKGFQENGIIATLKHFPGHGDTQEDTHSQSAYNHKTLEELKNCEWIPFRAGIDAGADFVMCAHITVPEVDAVPAVFSKKLITDGLRGELGFQGVVITDAMEMKAISDHYESDVAAVMAIEAGCDMILCPEDMHRAFEGIINALMDGTLTEERINQSVRRILTVKEKYGLLS